VAGPLFEPPGGDGFPGRRLPVHVPVAEAHELAGAAARLVTKIPNMMPKRKTMRKRIAIPVSALMRRLLPVLLVPSG